MYHLDLSSVGRSQSHLRLEAKRLDLGSVGFDVNERLFQIFNVAAKRLDCDNVVDVYQV